ncbi:MAG: hypothetical protein IPM18_10070 [Phycisphaerales bacterium]|nr:hypothetical protein [Phycisphaerales bacterium]
MKLEDLKPGQRIRIQQTIDRREGDWQHAIEGVVQKVEMRTTGSWFAHAKHNRFWLRRITLRKDNGELTVLALDPHATLELIRDTTTAHN